MKTIVYAALVAVCLPVAAANGAAISAGHTNPSDAVGGGPGAFQGTINAIVYDRAGGVAGDTFNTGVAGFDSSLVGGPLGAYLYIYQVTNSGPSTKEIFRATVDVASTDYLTSTAFVAPFDMVDIDGPVDATNDLGPDPAVYTQNALFDPASLMVGLAPTTSTIGVPVTTVSSSSFGAFFFPGYMPAGTHSMIFGFQSDYAPALVNAAVIDGVSANGLITAPISHAPEPGAAIALLSLVPLGLMLDRRRRRS